MKKAALLTISICLLLAHASSRLHKCDLKSNVGPINLDLPIQKKDHFIVKFEFDDVINPTIEKISHAHMRIVDDFGDIKFGFYTYAIKSLDIYTRSLHKISNESLPLEMIAHAELVPPVSIASVLPEGTTIEDVAPPKPPKKAKNGAKKKEKEPLKKLKFSILFEAASVPYIELFPLGIGRGMVKKLPTKREDPIRSKLVLHTTFNLNNLVDNYRKVIWYEANSIFDSCERVSFLVLFEKLWVGPNQLSEFRASFHKRLETTFKLANQTIRANFFTKT